MTEFWFRLLTLFGVLIVTDVILLFGLKRLLPARKRKGRPARLFMLGYGLLTIIFLIAATGYFFYIRTNYSGYEDYRQLYYITGAFLLIYLPKLVMLAFIVTENLILFFIQFLSFIFQNRKHYEFVRISRKFKLLSWTGYILAWLVFTLCLYSYKQTRTDYILVEESIQSKRLPASFDGLRIIQISDAHLGSFFSTSEFAPVIAMIQEQKPDIIVFTGDMVNVEAEETLPYLALFQSLHPPLGMYSVMGNHDHDDYMKVSGTEKFQMNNHKLAMYERIMGFTVLQNEHLFLHKGQDSIALIGVDSWGLKPFRQYGKLKPSMQGISADQFSILLTHIPQHWDYEVVKKTHIDLTLSGHTHALQFGWQCGDSKWSPITLLYKHFWGLYREGEQYLNVNAGCGYLGFPARIGIRPEVTLITLKRS